MARKKFSCDFETTTKIDDCRVWAFGYMEIGNKKNYKIGTSIVDFMEWCQKSQADLYFHNLRFDGEFIVNWLLKNGFKYDTTGAPKTFKTSISRMAQWYVVEICYGYKGKEKLHTVIYDSLKKLPFPVKKIAKDFGLPIAKGEINYHKERPVDYKLTEDEHEYIKTDIEIVADALHIQFKQGLNRITNGSDSLNGCRSIIGKNVFEKTFPIFSLELDLLLRKAYRGGFTWLNEKYAGIELNDGIVFDVNSLYPDQMYQRPLPYGMPIQYEGKYEADENYPLFIQVIRCEFELKPNKIPTIQLKNSRFFMKNQYLKSSDGEIVEIYVTNVDLELMEEHYDLYDVEYLTGWKFKSKIGMFNKFIDKWNYIKTTSEGAIRLLAKLMLNALYGKFATNPNVTGKTPYLKEGGETGYKLNDEEFTDPVYTPVGVFVTSWARHFTISTAQKCYDRIIYCDTDSIHLTGTDIPESIKDIVDSKKMGYWKHESTFKRGKYLRQKTYVHQDYAKIIEIDGESVVIECNPDEATTTKLSVKCAGMSDKIKESVTFENFNVGFKGFGNLKPMHVSGGVVLVDTEFTIK